jgi:hypothetical protein
MLDDSTHALQEREERWTQQRSHQIEFFVSKVSKTWLLLNELASTARRRQLHDPRLLGRCQRLENTVKVG